MNKIKIFKLFFILIILLSIIIWYSLYDNITCIIRYSKDNIINGYYIALGGIYINIIKNKEYSIPNILQIYNIHSKISKDSIIISQDHNNWSILNLSPRKKLYTSYPKHPQKYLYHPPSSNWIKETHNNNDHNNNSNNDNDTGIHVQQCKGSLADSLPLVPEQSLTNIQIMLKRPVTTVLCCINIIIAYILWSKRIESSMVAYSYDSIINREEYWRAITASFAHYDLLHLGFNVMSLYQLGVLEQVYSSPLFLILNFTLVIITMMIATFLYHTAIYSFNRQDLIYQQAVGYSCVLFAWMVASSVRMSQYCPLFFLPSLCFKTYFLNIPFLPIELSLPFNFGPFILLIVTKIILPRSSLIGHLSGIIIGFPLAWNWLNFTTPTLVISILSILLLLKNKLYIWNFPGYSINHTFIELSEFVSKDSLSNYINSRIVTICLIITIFFYIISTISLTFEILITDIFPRLTMIFFSFSSIHAIRCQWLTDLQAIEYDSGILLILTSIMLLFQSIFDYFSLISLITAKQLVISSLLYSYDDNETLVNRMYISGILSFLLLAIIEFYLSFLFLRGLQKLKVYESYLQNFELDRQSINQTLKSIGLSFLIENSSITSSSSTTLSSSTSTSTTFSHPNNNNSNSYVLNSNSYYSNQNNNQNDNNSEIARAALARQSALPTIFNGNRTKSSTSSTSSLIGKNKGKSQITTKGLQTCSNSQLNYSSIPLTEEEEVAEEGEEREENEDEDNDIETEVKNNNEQKVTERGYKNNNNKNNVKNNVNKNNKEIKSITL